MTITELYNKIYTDETTKESGRFIDIFETNRQVIDHEIIDGDSEMHYKVMRLTADYAHHLTMTKDYKKALPVINKAIYLFQIHSGFKEVELLNIEFYETLLFDCVIANFYHKKFKEANRYLRKLIIQFPEKVIYHNWSSTIRIHSTQKLINVLWYVITVAAVTTTLFDGQYLGVFHDIILYIGVTAFAIAMSAEVIKLIIKQRIKDVHF
ncbi:hypothetical protein V6R21_01945 [Limibacter armeniacum]|uniref:hypothetical protein n=1 Tax=Limibacter armeniacum TaxID=466084 RepID=UPI002FE68134